jgi:membrane protein YdbS with pleckstrin-like domain
MAIVKCPECNREVSSVAAACPACGYPVAEKFALPAPEPTPSTELLAEVRPSWWRYFWYLLFAWLLVPYLVAWFKRQSVVLRVYPGRITLERGLFSKCYREFFTRDIRSIDIDQSFLARLVNIGDLSISTAATEDASENVDGVPNPQKIRDLIITQRQGG